MREAVSRWAAALAARRMDVLRIGYFGSYARGDWGVGSDLDLLVLVRESAQPFWERSAELDLAGLPVPAEALVYTLAEWEGLAGQGRRFFESVEREAVWVYQRR